MESLDKVSPVLWSTLILHNCLANAWVSMFQTRRHLGWYKRFTCSSLALIISSVQIGLVLHQQKSYSRWSKSEQHFFKVQGKAQQFNEPDLIQGGPHSKGFVYLKVITHPLKSLRHRHNAGYFIRYMPYRFSANFTL